MRRLIGILVILITITMPARGEENNPLNLKDNLNSNINNAKIQNEQTKEYNQRITIPSLNDKVLNYSIMSIIPAPIMPDEIIYSEFQKSYNAIDPKKAEGVVSYYPGLRGPNQLIIYTPAYGIRTGTNEFGTEVIVENNMAVRLNGADSVIPQNGFVISGHGQAKKWITNNIQIGSKIYIDYTNGVIRVYLTPESLIYAAKAKLAEVNNLIDYYKKTDISYNDKKANEYVEESENCLKKAEKKPEKTQTYITDAMNSLNSAIKNTIPYISSELKGIWVRPTEKTPAAIEKTIERIHQAGITDIFLETYFHGKTIYPSKYLSDCGVTSQKEEFIGFDPLSVWINEAHKRQMKVHIWFETFYVGNENPKSNPNHVLTVYPLWTNKKLADYDTQEPSFSISEHNGYFLDPANIQVQTYLLGIIKEIIEKYKPDGINLDYIRYPQSVDSSFANYANTNWGYTQTARNEFKSLYGIDPVEIQYGTGDWELWSEYRQNRISKFVQEVKKLTKPNNILLTAVIFPDLKKSITTKMQNWRAWSMNNYIDGLTPLILTGDKNTANILLRDVLKNTNGYTKIFPGLFVTFMGGPFDELLIQIHKTREFNAKGAVLFDYAHLTDDYIEALNTRVFNNSYDKSEIKKKEPEEITQEPKTKKSKKKKNRRKDNDNN